MYAMEVDAVAPTSSNTRPSESTKNAMTQTIAKRVIDTAKYIGP
jgi:hypothetical protein